MRVNLKFCMTPARLAFTIAVAFCFARGAQAQAPPPPPIPAESTPAVPPPAPPYLATDPELEPQITIIKREDSTVEEVRVRGELRYVRVTPNHGRPYFLIPDPGGNTFIRRDSLDIQLKVPMWVLFSF